MNKHSNKGFFLTYWKGLLWGFLFGTFGIWILAMLSLMFAPVESLSGFLFAPGRALSSVLFGAHGSDGAVMLLMFFNGVLYALVGFVVQHCILVCKQR